MRGILIILLLPIWSFAQVSDATIKTNTNTNIRNASTVTRANHAAINDQLTDAKSSRIEAVTLAGTNTYTVNIAWVGSYQSGLNFLATFVNANSGVSTINVNSLGAKTLKKFSGGSKVDLASGDISAGQIYQLVYDGTFFQVSIPGTGGGGTWGSITGTLSSQTDLQSALDAKVVTSRSILTTSPLTGGGDLTSDRTISIPVATTSVGGYLTSTDWNTFNNKVSEYSNYYKVTTWAALQTYIAGLGAGVDVNIFFPYGTYSANSVLKISNKGNVNIIGEGSIITNAVSSPSDVFSISTVTSINIQGLYLDFNGNTNVGDFFDISTVTNIARFENLNFRNYGASTQAGLRLLNVPTPSANGQNFNEPGASFTNCTFSNSINYSTYDYNNNNTRGVGIYMTDATEYFRMVNCAFININVPLWLINGGNGAIVNCMFNGTLARISGTNYGAIYMVGGGSNGGKLLITNCTFNHNWGYSIWNDYNVTGRPMELINSHFIANAITPIVVNNGSSNNQLMNCFFDRANLASTASNNPYSAVVSRYAYFNNSSNNTISDNSFQAGVSGTAIVTLGTSGNNKIRNNDVATGVTLASLVGSTDIVSGNERKWTFQPDATVSGFNFGSVSAAPSTLVNADAFYNTATNQLSGRINGATRNFVFDDYAQTLTNKTISGASNTFSNIPNAAIIGLGSLALLNSVNNSNWSGTVLSVANGGTGTATPALVAGTNVTITGTWPNQTINSSGGGGGMTDPMTTRGDIIIRDATNTTARLGVGTNGQVLGTNGTDVSWVAAGGTTYYAPTAIVSNATDANFTATANGIHNILDGVATANRVITIPTGSNGDVLKFYNTEDTYVWSFTGATVYLSDRVTVVTQLLYNVPCFIEKIDGLWIIIN